jgi:RND family efflux transporter MFP subunit
MKQCMVAIASILVGLALIAPVSAAEGVELTTRVSGVVKELLVKPGQRVGKGAVLLRLDPTVLRAQLDEAAAEQMRADADEEDAKRELDRAEELFNRTVSSTSELEGATLRHVRAKATLATANARLAIAKKNLSDTELKAPFSGVVAAVPGMPGTVVVADCQPRPLVILKPGP